MPPVRGGIIFVVGLEMPKLPSLNPSKPGALKRLELGKPNGNPSQNSLPKLSVPAFKSPDAASATNTPAAVKEAAAAQSVKTPVASNAVNPGSISSAKGPPLPIAASDKTSDSDALTTSISEVVPPTVSPSVKLATANDKTSISDALATVDLPIANEDVDSPEPDKKTVVADLVSVLKTASTSLENEPQGASEQAQVFSSKLTSNDTAPSSASVRIPKADATITYSADKLVADMKATSETEPLDAKKASVASDNEEKYEVNVSHYANYSDESKQDVYSDGTKENLKYAAKTPGSRFFSDFVNVIARPMHFWESQNAHPATISEVFLPHLLTLIILRALAYFVGGMLKAESEFSHVLVQTLTQVLMIFVFILAFAFCTSTVTAIVGRTLNFNRAFKFSAYAITPILVTGILSVIPVPHIATICDLVAMPWAFCVMGCGVVSYLHMPEKSAPPITGLFCGFMMCLWGALPILLPYLVN